MVQHSNGLEISAIEAEVFEAERETLEFEAKRRAQREAELAAMDRQTRFNETHRAFRRCRQAERRARELGAVPPQQTKDEREQILAVYEEAEALTELTGLFHEVDHIIPLNGECWFTGVPNICGLHIASNLRAIPKSLNRMRGNRYFAGTPLSDDGDDDIPF